MYYKRVTPPYPFTNKKEAPTTRSGGGGVLPTLGLVFVGNGCGRNMMYFRIFLQ